MICVVVIGIIVFIVVMLGIFLCKFSIEEGKYFYIVL